MATDEDLDDLTLHALRFLAEDDPDPAEHPEMAVALADPATFAKLLDKLTDLDEDSGGVLSRGVGGPEWADWLEGNAVSLASIASMLPNLDALRRRLKATANPVRVSGQRHADNTIAQPQQGSLLFDLRNWQSPATFPLEKRTVGGRTWVRVFGWEKLQDLINRLDKAGLAPINTGSYTGQTVAGPLSMGTHGSGVTLGAMSDSVVAVDILGTDGPDGTVHRMRSADCPFPDGELVQLPQGRGSYQPTASAVPLDAAVVNLGAFGLVLSYVLEVVPTYWLEQSVDVLPLPAALAWIGKRANRRAFRHVEMVVAPFPVKDGMQAAILKRSEIAPGSKPRVPAQPLPAIARSLEGRLGRTKLMAGIVERSLPIRQHVFQGALDAQLANNGVVGPWSEVLIRNTGIAAYGFEVHFPTQFVAAGIKAILGGIQRALDVDGAKATGPLGVRFVKSGDQMIGMNYRQIRIANRVVDVASWCTVEVPRLYGTSKPDVIPQRILEALAAAGIPARPHWGQYFPLDQLDAAALYPKLSDWRAAREALGADARFLTPAVASATGIPQPRPVIARPLVASREAPQRVLFVHGVGGQVSNPDWMSDWERCLAKAAVAAGKTPPLVEFLAIDDLFEPPDRSAAAIGDALTDLIGTRLRYRTSRTQARGWLNGVEHWQDWDPAVVAQWLEDDTIRAALRQRLTDLIGSLAPDVVAAHSLGSLIAYDTLSQKGFPTDHRVHLVTFGSQIGHKGLRAVWGGRLQKPAVVDHWMHVHNPDDPVFTAPIPGAGAHNITILTDPDVPDPHTAVVYLDHPTVQEEVWPVVLGHKVPTRRLGTLMTAAAHRSRKALLVGIDRYASPGMNLEGCVNDVYRISALLQSRFGYAADDIRLLTNDRANAEAMRSRLDWLLDDAEEGDQRVFYFSGHGARVPGYNALEVVDQVDECLVAHDFDWDVPDSALVDDEFLERYAQLAYGVRFTAIFDCCHSGGMARSTAAQVRGITPPDDIRHRLLAYDGQTWTQRGTALGRGKALRSPARRRLRNAFLGSAQTIRPDRASFEAERAHRGHEGPYMPVLIYGCGEGELAFEHRVGPTVYGAFTHALSEALAVPDTRTFAEVVDDVRKAVKALGYAQRPDIEGPGVITGSPFHI